MEYEDYIKMGLEGEAPLKLILCGNVEENGTDKVGVVAVVYASTDKEKTKSKLDELIATNPNNYYMVYSVPMDTDLTTLDHFPSIEITKEDLI